jgi:hypothetical protein
VFRYRQFRDGQGLQIAHRRYTRAA